MIGGPPRSTPFPCPPLCRSAAVDAVAPGVAAELVVPGVAEDLIAAPATGDDVAALQAADAVADGAAVDAIVARSPVEPRDRKSTRLNSSHANISYAVFCLIK